MKNKKRSVEARTDNFETNSIDNFRLGPVLEFLRLLWSFDHALNRKSKQMEKSLGVTGPQRLAIRIVGRFPGISAGQLARILQLHPGTLSGILSRLEKKGYFRRRRDPRDARRVHLGLTASGRDIDKNSLNTIEGVIQESLSKLSRNSILKTREVLEVLIGHITKNLSDSEGE